MDLILILNQVLILFIIMLIGYVAGKAGVIDPTASKKLSGVMLYVTSPMLVLKSFFITFTTERLINVFWMMGMALFMYLLSIWLSRLIYGRFSEEAAPILRFSAVFSNCGYMGLPIMYALYGDDGFLRLFLYCRLQHHFVDLWLCHVWRSGTKREIVAKVLPTLYRCGLCGDDYLYLPHSYTGAL